MPQLYIIDENTSTFVNHDIDGNIDIYTYQEDPDGFLSFEYRRISCDEPLTWGAWAYPGNTDDFNELVTQSWRVARGEWRRLEDFHASDTWSEDEIGLLHDLYDVLHGQERAVGEKYDCSTFRMP